jgi:hypothetical protein
MTGAASTGESIVMRHPLCCPWIEGLSRIDYMHHIMAKV